MKGKRPDYTVSTVVQTDNGDRWHEIGVGFTSDKGGTITVLRKRQARAQPAEGTRRHAGELDTHRQRRRAEIHCGLRAVSPFHAAGRDPAQRGTDRPAAKGG